jgi:predicted lipoprotein with Yx(FWY)xxD motif
MYSFINPARLMVVAAVLTLSIVSCKQTNTTPAPDLAIGSTSLGNVLTAESGRTLYFFAPDANGNANCTGACRDTWPIFYQETPMLGGSLKASDFTTITRSDGAKQTAFKGWPLYYYKNDTKAGDVAGENIGNVWYVAKPNYTVLIGSGQLVGQDGKNYLSDTKEGTGSSLFLTDSVGTTLYAFANDKKNKNNYTKSDLSNNPTWPLFERSTGEVPSALSKADFGTVSVFGRTQLTYKGWPLYYFGNDQFKRGSTKGVSVPRPGVWPVVYKTTADAPAN